MKNKHTNLIDEIDSDYPKTTLEDVIYLAIGSVAVAIILLAVVIVGH